MTGLYGLGRAFNLKYRPNGPLKTYVYDRSFNFFDFGPRRNPRSSGNYVEQTIRYEAPQRSWLWDMADAIFGLAGLVNVFGAIRGNKDQASDNGVTPQGAKSQGATSLSSADSLKNLEKIAKNSKSGVIFEGNGTYTAYNTNDSIKGDYATVEKWLLNQMQKSNKKQEKAPAQEPTAAPTPAPTEAPTEAPTVAPTVAPEPEPAPEEEPTAAPIAVTNGSNKTKLNAKSSTDLTTEAPAPKPTEKPVVKPKTNTQQSASITKINKGIKYSNGNTVEAEDKSSIWDSDAIFTINGKKYELEQKFGIVGMPQGAQTLDYGDIMSSKQHDLIDPKTGEFNPNSKRLGDRNSKHPMYFTGKGELNGAKVFKLNGKVAVEINGKCYDLNTLLKTNQKVEIKDPNAPTNNPVRPQGATSVPIRLELRKSEDSGGGFLGYSATVGDKTYKSLKSDPKSAYLEIKAQAQKEGFNIN